ncbi:TPA: hypothetical protein EYP66_00310 [Candidatus Poribacteria bacterium]|nr:hypothetical protein [Candidatus Poribacteria bacterium]
MTRKNLFILAIVVLLANMIMPAGTKTIFEDDFSGGKLDKNWVLVPGAGKIELTKDKPPEYGPDVMNIDSPSGNTLAFVKEIDVKFTDGIIEILWIDTRLPEDVDGPLVARAQSMDEAGFNQSYLIEWDTDTGLHLDILGGTGVQDPKGSMSEGDWVWLKFWLEGNELKIKGWKAGEAEPKKWTLEWEDSAKTYESGAVGLRAWSGGAHVAFFRVTDLEGPSAVEPQDKVSVTWGKIKRDSP